MAKKKVGRPKKYTKKVIKKEAKELDKWANKREITKGNIYLGQFAQARGYPREYLSRWANDEDKDGNLINKEFNHAYKKARSAQETRLVVAGLIGKFNSTMTIFTLKNVSGWRDKSEVEHTGDAFKELFKQMQNEKEPLVKENKKSRGKSKGKSKKKKVEDKQSILDKGQSGKKS